ncbi:methyltransferase domain-containing protein [Frankia sp. Cj3]|uniref:methyltransferase domain-containing protein n=1 Tax=Frankia sp. Cj3 TaxID=2880976 RepID=UPI001EF6E62F|nr:methyltransferase domain-containing protein [Frankia sp. Cj3]
MTVTASTVVDGPFLSRLRWSFGGETVDDFDEHVHRSVPGYREGHNIIAQLSDFFVWEGSRVIEVGCSTATLTRLLAERHASTNATFHGVDIEPRMVDQARKRCSGLSSVNIELADAQRIDFTGSSFVVMYYTLQFFPPDHRLALLQRICTEMRPGGALVLFEKTRTPDARLQDLLNQMYEDFKLQAGFSADEILKKSHCLRGVLEPLTTALNLQLLNTAGFIDSWPIYKYLAFEGFLGVKPLF